MHQCVTSTESWPALFQFGCNTDDWPFCDFCRSWHCHLSFKSWTQSGLTKLFQQRSAAHDCYANVVWAAVTGVLCIVSDTLVGINSDDCRYLIHGCVVHQSVSIAGTAHTCKHWRDNSSIDEMNGKTAWSTSISIFNFNHNIPVANVAYKLQFFTGDASIWCFRWSIRSLCRPWCFSWSGHIFIDWRSNKRWIRWSKWPNLNAYGQCTRMGNAVYR